MGMMRFSQSFVSNPSQAWEKGDVGGAASKAAIRIGGAARALQFTPIYWPAIHVFPSMDEASLYKAHGIGY